MNRLSELLKRYVWPGIIAGITVDGYRRLLWHEKQDARKEEYQAIARKNYECANNQCENIASTDQKLGIEMTRANDINNRLIFSKGSEKEALLIEKLNADRAVAELKAQSSAEISALNNYLSGISKQDMFEGLQEWFQEWYVRYTDFLATLSLDQLVALINFIGFFMVLSALFSISSIVLGEYLIEKFNLKVRIPKLSTILEIRSKVSRALLWTHIFILFCIVFIFMGLNVYLFILKYFI